MMIRKVYMAALIPLGLSLAACGGDSVSSTPPPPPTPTPTPPPTYLKLTDLTGDRTFKTAGVKYDVGTAGSSNAASLAYPDGVQVAYTAATDSYTLSIAGATTTTFLPSDISLPQPAPNVVQYLKRNSGGAVTDVLTLIIPTSGGVPLNYTLVGTWGTNLTTTPTYRIGIGGIPTLVSDVPKTGSANYTVGIGGNANNAGTNYVLSPNSTATFAANFGAGTVATTINLSGVAGSSPTPVSFGAFTGTGTISSTTPGFAGTFSGTAFNASATTGVFSGAFFGPQAIEMGYAYALSAGTFNAVGAVTGTKQ